MCLVQGPCASQPKGSSPKLLHPTATAGSRMGKDSYRGQGIKSGRITWLWGNQHASVDRLRICKPDTSDI